MGTHQPQDVPVVGEQRSLLGTQFRRLGRQQGQRQVAQRPVGDDKETFGVPPPGLHRLQQLFIKRVRQREVEVGNVAQRRGIRFQRRAQPVYGFGQLVPAHVDGGKRHLAPVRDRPHVGHLLADIGGDQCLAGAQDRASLLDGRWPGVDQTGIFREPPRDLFRQRGLRNIQVVDLPAQRCHRLRVLLVGGCAEHVGEQPVERGDLLLGVLLAPRQICEVGIARRRPRPRGGERPLHRTAAGHVGDAERFRRRVESGFALQRGPA